MNSIQNTTLKNHLNAKVDFINTVHKNNKTQKIEFKDKFDKIKSDKVKEHLKDLYDKIVDQGDKIGDKLYIKDLMDYKKMVREFLDVAVKNSHSFSNQNFLDKRGRHRMYSVVKNVDRELSSLTQDFLNQEIDKLSVVKKLDDIRGMLMDVMM